MLEEEAGSSAGALESQDHGITCDLARSAVSVPLSLLVELAAGTGCEQEVGRLGAACTGKGSAERAQTWLCT